jgi:predicted transcriptional regulator
MKNFLKCRGLEDILHWTLVAIALYFSLVFYSDMLFGLLVAGIVFEIMKPNLFENGIQHRKSIKGYVFISLGSIFILLSLLATCSALTNNYNKLIADSTKQVETKEYRANKAIENSDRSKIKNLEKQLNDYPTLDSYTKDVPSTHSTNLKQITRDWQLGKQNIQDKLDKANDGLNKTINAYKNIKQYKTVKTEDQFKSYTKLFNTIASKININADYIAITVFILIAVLIEIGIVVTKHIATIARQKKLGTYKMTYDERLKETQEKIFETAFNKFLVNMEQYQLTQDKTIKNYAEMLEEKQQEKLPEPTKKIEIENNVDADPVVEDEEKNINTDETNVLSMDNYSKMKELDMENVKKYFDYLLENSKNDIAIGYKKVAEKLGLTQGEGLRIFKHLKENGYLETEDRKTKIVKHSMEV